MLDERNKETRERFPLRQIRLDLCVCGHDDSYHQTEVSFTGVKDGSCCICVCKGFELPNGVID